MQPFTTLTGPAAPLLLENVDTDMIIPKQFLKTIQRSGLGQHLFHELRRDAEGREQADFVLNHPRYRAAKILLSGANFGCGSSREHAPWALVDFGLRCVIAPSFADIFHNNCTKNGLLPVLLERAAIEALARVEGPLTVDLPAQEVRGGDLRFAFSIDPALKLTLLEGLDDIAHTERRLGAITAFEAAQRVVQPWL
jgi:3-isopropylmalate/(R)-2-methylmalate dehydratase small subunit